MRKAAYALAVLITVSILAPSAGAVGSLDADPGAGPWCPHRYCLTTPTFAQYPLPPGNVALTTAAPNRSVSTELTVNWRGFPEAGQTLTVDRPITFDAAHLWNVGVTLMTPAGLDAYNAANGQVYWEGGEGFEYRPTAAEIPITLSARIYRLAALPGDRFTLQDMDATEIASGSSRTTVSVGRRSPMSVSFPSPVTLSPGTYLFAYKLSDAPAELLSVFMAGASNGTIEAGQLVGQPNLDYAGGTAYLKGSYGNGQGGRINPPPITQDDWVLLMARVSNNAAPPYVLYAPGDVLLDLTSPAQVPKVAPSIPVKKKACLSKPGFRWNPKTNRCIRRT